MYKFYFLALAKSTDFTIKKCRYTGAIVSSNHRGGRIEIVNTFNDTTKNIIRPIVQFLFLKRNPNFG